ncbi:MAG: hypothetical protein L0323_11575 [Planctomycetes bacterium]|nr:hypothetical protein [Planctomycetota bacterium]
MADERRARREGMAFVDLLERRCPPCFTVRYVRLGKAPVTRFWHSVSVRCEFGSILQFAIWKDDYRFYEYSGLLGYHGGRGTYTCHSLFEVLGLAERMIEIALARRSKYGHLRNCDWLRSRP